jgi:hypothetical protein
MPFREDIEKIDEYDKAMASWNTSIFVSLFSNKLGKIIAFRVLAPAIKMPKVR